MTPPSFSEKKLLDNDTVAAWVFLAPALVILSIFVLFPIFYLLYLSFTGGSFTSTGTYWVGLKNYRRLFLSLIFGKLSAIQFILPLLQLSPV